MATTVIAWDARFELGIELIDRQHKKLVGLCNMLHQEVMENRAGAAGDWHDSLRSALKECADYVLVHFRNEEALMKAAQYRQFAAHKGAHDQFTQKVLDTVKRFDSLSVADALQFVHFLHDWILSHIAHEDRLFAKPVIAYMRAQRGGA